MYLDQAYANTGQLQSITGNTGKQFVSALAYNPGGQVTSYGMGLAGGTVNATLGYSPQRLQLGSISYTYGATTLFSLSYGYTQNGGNNGQITSIVDNVNSGRSATYGYDALNRLTSFSTTGSTSYPQKIMSWTYDRYSNRLTQVLNGGTQTVNPSTNTNRLNLPYDANGNLTSDGTYGLSWDAENRMVSYASGSVKNEYDASGIRVRRTKTSGTDVVYIFATGGKVLAEYAPGAIPSNPSVEYIYVGSQLIASKVSSAYTFYERDHLSVRGVLADAAPGSPTEQGHLPFGEGWYGSNVKWKFTSYERDSDIGDDFALFRRYQYAYGRFSSPDPVGGRPGDPQSLNRYKYARNIPTTLVDPAGLDEFGFCGAEFSSCGDGGGGSGGSDGFGGGGGGTTWDGDLIPRGFASGFYDMLWGNFMTPGALNQYLAAVAQAFADAKAAKKPTHLEVQSDCILANGARQITYALENDQRKSIDGYYVTEHIVDRATNSPNSTFTSGDNRNGPGTSSGGSDSYFTDRIGGLIPFDVLQTFTASTTAPGKGGASISVFVVDNYGQAYGTNGIFVDNDHQVFVNGNLSDKRCQ